MLAREENGEGFNSKKLEGLLESGTDRSTVNILRRFN
jgi:hypothetical protein